MKLHRTYMLVAIAILWGGYWMLAPHFGVDFVAALASAAAFSVALGVTVAFFGGFWQSVRERSLEGKHLLVIGIWGAWLHNVLASIWAWGFRFYERPEWMQSSYFRPFLYVVLATFGIMHLGASSVLGDTPSRWARAIGIGVAMTAAMTTVLLYLAANEDMQLGRDIIHILIEPVQ